MLRWNISIIFLIILKGYHNVRSTLHLSEG